MSPSLVVDPLTLQNKRRELAFKNCERAPASGPGDQGLVSKNPMPRLLSAVNSPVEISPDPLRCREAG